jgi:hypothetical protein
MYTNLSVETARLSRKIAASTRREKHLRLSRTRSSTFLPCSERLPLTHDPYSSASPSLPALSGRVADTRCLPGFVTSTARVLMFRMATSTPSSGGGNVKMRSFDTDRPIVSGASACSIATPGRHKDGVFADAYFGNAVQNMTVLDSRYT